MNLSELIDELNSRPQADWEQIESAALKGHIKGIQAIVDRRMNQAIASQQRTIAEKFGGSEKDVLARLDAIEQAAEKRIKKAELDAHLKIRCAEAAVPASILADLPFDSAESIDQKVLELARAIADNDATERRRMVNEESFKPGGTGEVEFATRGRDLPSLHELNRLTTIELNEIK
jgi:DNA-binding Lrp family transcriptional regulator